MKLLKEVKEFFESYEVMNTMFDRKGIYVDIFESSTKNILQVKIIEAPLKGNHRTRAVRNMFCDVKVERNMIKMIFKYKEVKTSKEFTDAIKSIKKNDYVIKLIGNQLSITIVEPRIEEVSKIFSILESHCRRFILD